jgi:hypothetical protein
MLRKVVAAARAKRCMITRLHCLCGRSLEARKAGSMRGTLAA